MGALLSLKATLLPSPSTSILTPPPGLLQANNQVWGTSQDNHTAAGHGLSHWLSPQQCGLKPKGSWLTQVLSFPSHPTFSTRKFRKWSNIWNILRGLWHPGWGPFPCVCHPLGGEAAGQGARTVVTFLNLRLPAYRPTHPHRGSPLGLRGCGLQETSSWQPVSNSE